MTDTGNSTSPDDQATDGGEAGGNSCCNPQITDGVTQSASMVLGLGPATAEVNAYLGLTQAQTALFVSMNNQQAHFSAIAAATLTRGLSQMFAGADDKE